MDELALQEALVEAESAGKHNAHGVASFRLSGLLDQSHQLVMAYGSSRRELEGNTEPSPATPAAIAAVAPRMKMRSDICQRKRREIPKGGVEDWHLSDEERIVRWPGAYLDAGSSLGLRQVDGSDMRVSCAVYTLLGPTCHRSSSYFECATRDWGGPLRCRYCFLLP